MEFSNVITETTYQGFRKEINNMITLATAQETKKVEILPLAVKKDIEKKDSEKSKEDEREIKENDGLDENTKDEKEEDTEMAFLTSSIPEHTIDPEEYEFDQMKKKSERLAISYTQFLEVIELSSHIMTH